MNDLVVHIIRCLLEAWLIVFHLAAELLVSYNDENIYLFDSYSRYNIIYFICDFSSKRFYLFDFFAVNKFLSCIMLIGNVMCAVTTAEVTKSFFQFYSLFLFP